MQYTQQCGLNENSLIFDVDCRSFCNVLLLLLQTLAKYLNIEQQAHWQLIQERTNQLCHVIMM